MLRAHCRVHHQIRFSPSLPHVREELWSVHGYRCLYLIKYIRPRLANELLEIYLTNRLHELERRERRKRVKNGFTGKVLRWTGTKRALVELIYALDSCGCLNKGTVDIKEIVAYFEYVFDIDLGDFYHTYMELKAKTKDRTGFLSTLKDRLLMRMREQD